MKKKIIQLLACPACGGHLYCQNSFLTCRSRSCLAKYSVRAGIPILLEKNKLDEHKQKEKAVFDDLAAYQELMSRPYFQELKQRLVEKLASYRFKEKTILEIGAGTSLFLPIFEKANNLVASDINYTLLSQTKTKAALLVADAENLPFADQSFDFVYLIGLLHHLQDQRRAWQEIKRVLKPKGCFFVSEPTRESVNLVYYLLRRLALFLMGEARLKKLTGCGSPDESFISLKIAQEELGPDYKLKLTQIMPVRFPPFRFIEGRFSTSGLNAALEKTFLKRFGTIVWLEGRRHD